MSHFCIEQAIEHVLREIAPHLEPEVEIGKRINLTEAVAQHRVLLAMFQQPFSPLQCDVGKLGELIRCAEKGNAEADAQVRVAAAMLLEAARPLPVLLQRYVAKTLRDGIKKPTKKHRLQNRPRDLQIAIAVHALEADFGIRPTRNYAAHGNEHANESGCSIVSKALAKLNIHLSEGAVEKVWKKLAHLR